MSPSFCTVVVYVLYVPFGMSCTLVINTLKRVGTQVSSVVYTAVADLILAATRKEEEAPTPRPPQGCSSFLQKREASLHT